MLDSLLGQGFLKTHHVRVEQSQVLSQVAQKFKMEEYQKIELPDQEIHFKIQEQKVKIDPFNFQLGGSTQASFGGAHHLNQSLEYDLKLQVHTEKISKQAQEAVNQWASQLPLGNKNLNLASLAQIHVKIEGTVLEPQLRFEVLESVQGVSDALMNQAQDLAKKAQEELEKKAQEELEKSKKKLEEEAKKKLEEELKKKLEEELKKKLKNPFGD
jgi:hypothetical protein